MASSLFAGYFLVITMRQTFLAWEKLGGILTLVVIPPLCCFLSSILLSKRRFDRWLFWIYPLFTFSVGLSLCGIPIFLFSLGPLLDYGLRAGLVGGKRPSHFLSSFFSSFEINRVDRV